jgi:hypothetical protein
MARGLVSLLLCAWLTSVPANSQGTNEIPLRTRWVVSYASALVSTSVSADGELVAASQDATAQIWESRSRKVVASVPGKSLAFVGTNQFVIIPAEPGEVELWQARPLRHLSTWAVNYRSDDFPSYISQIFASPVSGRAVLSNWDVLFLMDSESGAFVPLPYNQSFMRWERFAFSGDGALVAAGGTSGPTLNIVSIWNKDGNQVSGFNASNVVRNLALSTKGDQIAMIAGDQMEVRDVKTEHLIRAWQMRWALQLSFAQDDTELLLTDNTNRLHRLNIADGTDEIVTTVQGIELTMQDSFSLDGSKLVYGSYGSPTSLLNTRDGSTKDLAEPWWNPVVRDWASGKVLVTLPHGGVISQDHRWWATGGSHYVWYGRVDDTNSTRTLDYPEPRPKLDVVQGRPSWETSSWLQSGTVIR